jgi:hypothetical protein
VGKSVEAALLKRKLVLQTMLKIAEKVSKNSFAPKGAKGE